MKKTIPQIVLALLLFVINVTNVNAQILLKEVSLKKQIENSSLVVEGKVLSKKSFWDAENKNIYTANVIEVYKVFKGNPLTTIEVITPGGTVGLFAEIVSPSLKLNTDDVGVFTLYNNNIKKNTTEKYSINQFKPYGSSQGFYKYNLYDNIVVNTFNKTKGIASVFYDKIKSYTKTNYVELSKFDVQAAYLKSSQNKAVLAPGSITFTPTTATAGTKSVLTINGTGFGATKGKVSFPNADTGGATFVDALSTQILTWGNTQITVEIPSEAGTGAIRVTDASSASAISANSLTILYSEINVMQDGGNIAYRVQHINANGVGGYTWQMFTDFNNNANAKASFLRAFDSWRCTTGINWVVGTATTLDVAEAEGINVVRFDNGAELDPSELGRCTTYFSGCATGTGTNLNWYVSEMDIVFDDATDWNYSSANNSTGISQYDFESNALHELGHGRLLGHVIDTNDVMNYAISNSEEQRVLGSSNITCASAIQTRSTTIVPCLGTSVMENHPCYLSVEDEELKDALSIYPNPARGSFNIKNTSLINLNKVVIYDLGGRLISEYDMTNSSRIKTINLLGVSKGMYFVNIHSEKAMITKKLILE